MIVCSKYRFCYIHVPKTGGASVAQTMLRSGVPLDGPDLWPNGWFKSPNGHVTNQHSECSSPENQAILVERTGWQVAATARNPWSRMISCWAIFGWEELELVGNMGPIMPRGKHLPFELFLEQFCDPAHEYPIAWNGVDPRQCQHAWIDGCDDVMRFEEFKIQLTALWTRLGIARRIRAHLHIHKNPDKPRGQWESHYTPKLAQMVGDLWGEDATRYGYDPPM